jgi:hypothetical protein
MRKPFQTITTLRLLLRFKKVKDKNGKDYSELHCSNTFKLQLLQSVADLNHMVFKDGTVLNCMFFTCLNRTISKQ